MKVSELISLLQNINADTPVVIRGYENGYNDILRIENIQIKKHSEDDWWNGTYELSSAADSFPAVNLFGKNPNDDDE